MRSGIRLVGFLFLVAAAFVAGRLLTPSPATIATPGSRPGLDAQRGVETGAGFYPAEVDLGDQFWGTQIPIELTFANRSTGPIVVSRLEASCSCALIEDGIFVGAEVPPGSELIIPALFDVETNPGRKAARVTLTSMTGLEYRATIVANVLGTWSVSPATVDFGRIVLDDPAARASEVLVYESVEDELLEVDVGDADWIETRVVPRGDAVTEILLRVRRECLPAGVSSASLIVRTTSPIKPAAVVYVRAKGVCSLVAEPDHVTLVGSEPQIVIVKDESGAPAQLEECTSDDPRVTVEVLGRGRLRVLNPTGAVTHRLVTLSVHDERGRIQKITVSTF